MVQLVYVATLARDRGQRTFPARGFPRLHREACNYGKGMGRQIFLFIFFQSNGPIYSELEMKIYD